MRRLPPEKRKTWCLGSGWNCSEIHSELLEEHEGEDGLGSQSHERGNVALVECHGPVPAGVPDKVEGPGELPRLGVHGAGLEDIQRLGHGGGDGAGAEARGEVGHEVVREVGGPQQQPLHLVVETQLSYGHQHRSSGGPVNTIKELLDSLLLADSYQAVNSVFVIPPLLGRQLDVVLHPDVDHVARRAHYAAAAAIIKLWPKPIFSPLGDTDCLDIS